VARVLIVEDHHVVAEGLADCYVSHNRATEDLLTWVQTHKNKNDRPTVEGFDGETWADNLPLDFDAEDDVQRALTWMRQVLDWLEGVGVDLRAIQVYYSGAKGVHLQIPHTLFGGFAPSADPGICRRAARHVHDPRPDPD